MSEVNSGLAALGIKDSREVVQIAPGQSKCEEVTGLVADQQGEQIAPR